MLKNDVSHLSPIEYAGMRVVVDGEGVQAPGYEFAVPDREPESFAARWIYVNQEAWPGSHDLALFRRSVELTGAPQRVIARISADVCFRLYVNGVMVARGPDDIGSDIPVIVKNKYAISTRQWLYVVRDLTPHFREGVNVIAAEVLTYGRAGAYLTAGRPGFWFDAEVTCVDRPVITMASDASWESMPGEYLAAGAAGHASGADLVYLAAKEPVGWMERHDEASQWEPASEIDSIWGPMAASEIPPCMEVRYPVKEVVVVEGPIDAPSDLGAPPHPIRIRGNGSFCLNVDRVIPAYVGFTIDGCAGAELRVSWEEQLGASNRAVACVLRDGMQTFEFPGYGSCTTLRVEAFGVTRPFEIHDIQLVFTSQPVEYTGRFECSDPELNAKWQAARHALQICMQTHHLDSPHHQEPISDPGDYLIEALMNYYAFGSPWLARQDLRKFAKILDTVNYRNFHTSYSLLWVQMLMDYHDYTGDRDTVLEVAAQVHGLLDTFASWQGANGLICNAPSYMFMDWVEVAGFNVHHPPAVIGIGYMSAFYYRALADGIRVAILQGDEVRVSRYHEQRTGLHRAFNECLWDAENGLYRDGIPFVSDVQPHGRWLPADQAIATHTPHVNSLAVLYDLAPQDEQAGIMHRVMADRSVEVQPYFMHFVLEALDHAGLFEEYAIGLFKRWDIVPETGTFYEMWGKGDLSHAWNGTLLYQMSSKILGVTPGTPGFEAFNVAPKSCGLDYAMGTVPTPHGPITVRWTCEEGELNVQVEGPDPRCKTC